MFEVVQEADGGFCGECLTENIFTEGDTWEELRKNALEATAAFFFDGRLRDAVVAGLIKDAKLESNRNPFAETHQTDIWLQVINRWFELVLQNPCEFDQRLPHSDNVIVHRKGFAMRRAPRAGDNVHIPQYEKEALRLMLQVKPTADMPRAGANPSRERCNLDEGPRRCRRETL